jgi:DNA-binding response OmpR family regulator
MSKASIVAIDDEAEFIDFLKDYFSPRGYDIEVTLRGAKGVEIIKAKNPDVVLMDLKMPGADGDDILSMLLELKPAPKVIIISAYDDGGKTKARLLNMGAYAYFDKPIASLKVLEDKINEAVKT